MIEKINNIFETQSIYRSIIVCKDTNINTLYRTLRKCNYPVSKVSSLYDFNSYNSRLLIIDEVDASFFNILTLNIDMKDINHIIYCDKSLSKIENVSPLINHLYL